MKKRLLATVLWFYATWYGWSILADMVGLPALLGPVVALAVAAVIGLDTMHRIWTKRSGAAASTLPVLGPETA
jgi:hypothetical protein